MQYSVDTVTYSNALNPLVNVIKNSTTDSVVVFTTLPSTAESMEAKLCEKLNRPSATSTAFSVAIVGDNDSFVDATGASIDGEGGGCVRRILHAIYQILGNASTSHTHMIMITFLASSPFSLSALFVASTAA